MGRVVHLRVDGVPRDGVDELAALLLLHLPALLGRDLDLAALDDLRDDLQGVGGLEHRLEVLLGRAVAPGGVLEDVLGGDDVLQLAVEVPALDGEGGVGVDQDLEPRAVGLEARGDGVVERNHGSPYAQRRQKGATWRPDFR